MMRRSLPVLVLMLALGANARADAPIDVTGPDGAPEQLRLRSDDSALVVHFWATWCPECVVELPALAVARDDCAARGVRIVAVDVGEPRGQVERFLADREIAIATRYDPTAKVWRGLRTGALPTNLIWTPDGRRVETGPRDAAAWRELLTTLGCRAEGEVGALR